MIFISEIPQRNRFYCLLHYDYFQTFAKSFARFFPVLVRPRYFEGHSHLRRSIYFWGFCRFQFFIVPYISCHYQNNNGSTCGKSKLFPLRVRGQKFGTNDFSSRDLDWVQIVTFCAMVNATSSFSSKSIQSTQENRQSRSSDLLDFILPSTKTVNMVSNLFRVTQNIHKLFIRTNSIRTPRLRFGQKLKTS